MLLRLFFFLKGRSEKAIAISPSFFSLSFLFFCVYFYVFVHQSWIFFLLFLGRGGNGKRISTFGVESAVLVFLFNKTKDMGRGKINQYLVCVFDS